MGVLGGLLVMVVDILQLGSLRRCRIQRVLQLVPLKQVGAARKHFLVDNIVFERRIILQFSEPRAVIRAGVDPMT